MFKKSIYIVLIQIIGIVLGFISVFLVAGDIDPEVYSIIGLYQIVCNITMTLTGWGVESTLTRNALYWERNCEYEKVKEYATQAILTKFVSGAIVMPVTFLYLIFMNFTKYNGRYILLFICLLIGAFTNLLIDTMRNIVRAEGGYVFTQVIGTLNATILKLLGIILYFRFGACCYLYFYVLSPIPILLCFIVKCRKNLKFRYVKVRPMFKKAWEAKYLWLRNDLEFIRSNIDSLLVSFLFPSSIMGSYSIYKSLEQMMRNFIEGFFDVLSQNTVRYKGDEEALNMQEKKIKFARNICMGAILVGILIYCPSMSWWISLVNLSNYEGMENLVLCIVLGGFLYLLGKYEINAISFLAETKMNFIMTVINAIIAIASYFIIIISPTLNAVIIQRLVSYAMASFIAVWFFRRSKKKIYCEMNK